MTLTEYYRWCMGHPQNRSLTDTFEFDTLWIDKAYEFCMVDEYFTRAGCLPTGVKYTTGWLFKALDGKTLFENYFDTTHIAIDKDSKTVSLIFTKKSSYDYFMNEMSEVFDTYFTREKEILYSCPQMSFDELFT